MYHLAEVRWQQGLRDNAIQLMQNSLEIMESQVGAACCVRTRAALCLPLMMHQGSAPVG